MKPFQFMLATRGILDRARLLELARTAESIGYSHVCIHDHLTQQLAPIPTLTAVAMATERIRLYPLVLNNDLRHPAVLAQDLASLDVISEGRVVVGIGAGWNEAEYKATGIRFDAPGVRIERLAEAVVVMTAEEVLESPYTLIGTVPDLVAKLRRARDRWGINSYLVRWVGDPGLADVAPLVEQLAGT